MLLDWLPVLLGLWVLLALLRFTVFGFLAYRGGPFDWHDTAVWSVHAGGCGVLVVMAAAVIEFATGLTFGAAGALTYAALLVVGQATRPDTGEVVQDTSSAARGVRPTGWNEDRL